MPAKKDFYSLLGIGVLLAVFYPDFFIAKSAALTGDHWEQHFAWAHYFAAQLKAGQWPFWTPLIHAGFPLAAEGQIGIFYPPNLLLYGLLPVHWAYSYSSLVHFFISGAGTYAYARQIKLSPSAAFVAAVIFLFGTAYGGASYNITSLKTLCWFPWLLFLFERFLALKKIRYLAGLSFGAAFCLLAGYLQYAILALAMLCFYVLIRLFFFPEAPQSGREKIKTLFFFTLAMAGGLILASSQIFLTFRLAMESNRINLTEDYAYAGSMSPLALLTLFFPKFQAVLRGNSLYSGILALYWMVCAFFAQKKTERRVLFLWIAMGGFSLLMALGQASPLYIAVIKLSHFYSFRVPAKFLVFVCFSMAVVSGLGLQVMRESLWDKPKEIRRAALAYTALMGAGMSAAAGVYYFVTHGRETAIRWGEWLVSNYIYGRSGHPHSLQAYFDKLRVIADDIQTILSLANPWHLWALAVIVMSGLCVALTILGGAAESKRKKSFAFFFAAALGLLLADLYCFSAADIKLDFNTYARAEKRAPVVDFLIRENEAGRVMRLYGFRKPGENLPLQPAANMLYGIADIGVYSPFVKSRYFESIGLLGNVNDSNFANEPAGRYVLERLPLLSALGVSHILASQPLESPDLILSMQDPQSGAYLYQNRQPAGLAHFTASAEVFSDWPTLQSKLMSAGFDPRQVLLLERSEAQKLKNLSALAQNEVSPETVWSYDPVQAAWIIQTPKPGFFVWMQTFEPCWQAELDGASIPVLKAYGLFQAVWIAGEGRHVIRFFYKPFCRQ